jgi:hypothetical protein
MESDERLHVPSPDNTFSPCASKRSGADVKNMSCGQSSPKRRRTARQSGDVCTRKLRSASKISANQLAEESQCPHGEQNEINVRRSSGEPGPRTSPRSSLHAPFIEESLRVHGVRPGLTCYGLPSLGDVTVTATVNADDSILHLSPTDPAALLQGFLAQTERIVGVEDITLKLLSSSGPWQISGRLRLDDAHKDAPDPMDMHTRDAPKGGSAWQLQQRARALCAGGARYPPKRCAVPGGGAASLASDDDDDDYTSEGDDNTTVHRSNERWDPLDEKRLLTWRREGTSWKWIFQQFPSRTAAAIRTRHHMLLQKENAGSTAIG